MRQIFLSHNSADAAAAKRLRDSILAERQADKIFLSSEHGAGPVGGTNWQSWIRNVVTNCDVVVFIASKGSWSTWCSAELGMAQLLDKPIVPLHVGSAIEVNPLISHLQVESLDQPIEAILALIDNRAGVPISDIELEPGFVPYPGLDPLGERQAGLLFGRSVETKRILRDFSPGSSARLVMVSGPSGSGKSSLIRAGVAPALKAKGWEIAGPTQPQQLADEGLLDITVDRPQLLIVDQAEELALLDIGSSEQIGEWLHRVLNQGVWVLLVVRSEFRTEVGIDLPKPIDHYIPFLGRDELYEIVRGPAKLANLGIRESLVDRLVGETGSGEALPLLALTLHELWKQRDTLNNELTEATLTQLGGVHGVLKNLANEALAGALDAPTEQPPTVDNVLATLTRLATPNRVPPTRSPIRAATLSDSQRSWLDEFAKVGLVVYRTSYALEDRLGTGLAPTGEDLVDISHEALLNWTPLAEAIERERDRNIERQSIERSGREWDDGGREDTNLLLAGDRLRFAQNEQMDNDDPVLRAFVAASIKHDWDRRVRRWLITGLAVASVLAVVAAGLAFGQQRQATSERDAAQAAEADARTAETAARTAETEARTAETEAQSLRIASQSAAALSSERDVALMAAVAAYRTSPSVDTEGALLAALNEPEGPLYYFSDDRADWSTLRLLDENRGLVAGPAGLGASVVSFETGEMQRLGANTEMDKIAIEEIRRIPHSRSVIFFGVDEDGGYTAGTYDFETVTSVSHPVPIQAAAADANWLVFGDFAGGVYAVALSADGPAEPLRIDDHEGVIADIDLSRDGQLVAASSQAGVRLSRMTLDGWGPALDLAWARSGAATLESIAFRRDGNRGGTNELYAAGSDPRIRRWLIGESSVGDAEEIGDHIGSVNDLVADPEAGILISAGLGGDLQRWNMDAGAELGRPLRAHRLDVEALSTVGATNRSYPVVSTSQDTAIVWDLAPARSTRRTEALPESWDNESVASLVLGDGPMAVVTHDGRVLMADGSERQAPPDVSRAWWTGEALVFERRNDFNLAAGVTVWSMIDGEIEEMADAVGAVDVSSCLVAIVDNTSVRYADPGGCGSVPARLELNHPANLARSPGVLVTAFSPDEQQLAVLYQDNFIEVYDVASGDVVTSIDSIRNPQDLGSRPATVPTGVAWVDDRRLIVGHDRGGTTELIDLDAPENSISLDLHDDAVRWLVVDQAGDRLFTGGEDSQIRQTSLENQLQVVSTFTSRRRQRENEEEAKVQGLLLREDESILLSLQDSRVVAWELNPERLVVLACQRAGRQPTNVEKQRLGLEIDQDLC